MSEFEQNLRKFDEVMAKRQAYKRSYNDCFSTAEEIYNTLNRIRYETLQNTLKEKGLAVCAELHLGATEGLEKPTAEQLGIFPRDQMKLRFVQGMWGSTEHFTMVSSEFPVVYALLLCPEHFTENILVYESKDWPGWPEIDSEMVREDGKLILKDGGKDVTDLINKLKKGTDRFIQSEIKVDGEPNPRDSIYRYFNIPDLPEDPRHIL